MNLIDSIALWLGSVGADIKRLGQSVLPPGGTPGQVLIKYNNENYSTKWADPPTSSQSGGSSPGSGSNSMPTGPIFRRRGYVPVTPLTYFSPENTDGIEHFIIHQRGRVKAILSSADELAMAFGQAEAHRFAHDWDGGVTKIALLLGGQPNQGSSNRQFRVGQTVPFRGFARYAVPIHDSIDAFLSAF